jgi:hypothetical protein
MLVLTREAILNAVQEDRITIMPFRKLHQVITGQSC